MAATDKVKRPDFAVEKMSILYSALPRLFPRIKMINWFNMNTMKHAPPGRQLNNYSLTEDSTVLSAYRSAIQSPYYIGSVQSAQSTLAAQAMPRPLALGQSVSGQANLSIWVKSYVPRPKVYLEINNKLHFAGSWAGAHSISVDSSRLQAGRQRLTAYVFDDKNRFVTSASTTINVTRGRRVRGVPETVEPMLVSGTVQRYYVDASGFVSALELETPGETAWIHFPPQLAQQLMNESPIGAPANLWLLPRTPRAETPNPDVATQWNLVGIGEVRPVEGFLTPTTTSAIDTLEAGMANQGTPQSTLTGRLTNVIAADNGEVVALVLDEQTLVRVPRGMRRSSAAAGEAGVSKVLWEKNAEVTVSVQPEIERTGTNSHFKNRWMARTIAVNGQDITAGVPPISLQQAAQLAVTSVVDNSEPALATATQLGLRLYLIPISERRTRGEAPAPTVESLVDASARPW
jgi:hypothetical protein